jgi:ATP-dependent DNA helicase RecQ
MDKYQQILHEYWGYDDFRGIQRDIIESISEGKDTLGLMPTGGGKSITFQVPALAAEGVCIVITPLIALMKDQVAHLKLHGISAAAIYSGLSHSEILTILENSVYGGVKILYVSPERLSTDLFINKLKHIRVSFITVDEAHCISQWGYDFRPSYLEIAKIRDIVSDAPILALTATATPAVVTDIQKRLGFKHENVFRMSFERSNLAYIVRRSEDKEGEIVHILSSISGSAIVYTRSRRRTREIAERLNDKGISALFYHAGLENADKDKRQQSWMSDETRVMVATNAFGMGIDKPDVRMVIHADMPDSPEAYFQEAGRAGRDGKKSYAVLLYNNNDRRKLSRRIADTFPDKDYISTIYEQLAYFYQIAMGSGYGVTHEFNIDKFCRNYKHFPVPVNSALKILARAGYIDYDEEGNDSSRVMFALKRHELNSLDYLESNEKRVVESLLRNYGGLFTDYAYIDESMIAISSGINTVQTHEALKLLGRRRIISYIPASSMPLITYIQRREEKESLRFPASIYEERREQYKTRIDSMLKYAANDTVCRSRLLLQYFGETNGNDCGQCDVCIERRKHNSGLMAEDRQRAQNRILDVLSDGNPHPISELKKLYLPEGDFDTVLETLLHEEVISTQDGAIRLSKTFKGKMVKK